MVADPEVERARAEGARFFVATVARASEEKVGTRSQTAVYAVAVEAVVTGEVPAELELKHLGKTALASGTRAVMAALPPGRFAPAWQLLAHWLVEGSDPANVAATFAAHHHLGETP